MQSKISENVEPKEHESQRTEKERCLMEYEDKERHFRENFKYGATTVLKQEGRFFFWGDISHCGRENIFFNARKIKSMMEQNGHTMGHMNYNDPPTFSSEWDWEWEQRQRKGAYSEDLFILEGDEIREAEPMGGNPGRDNLGGGLKQEDMASSEQGCHVVR